MRRVGILTCGADSPGQNAAIRAVARKAFDNNYEVIGINSGFNGLLNNNAFVMDKSTVSGILQVGGTILGTSIGNPFLDEKNIKTAKDNFCKLSLTSLVIIGGFSYMKIAETLYKNDIPIIGIPATIDNDIPHTDRTIGFDSAIEFVASSLDRLHATASAHHRVFLVEVMGGGTGWIGILGGLSGGADLILVPEKSYTVPEILNHIDNRQSSGKDFSIIVISEEIKPPPDLIKKYNLNDLTDVLHYELSECCRHEVRKLSLGHLQRGGSPTAFDRILATLMGVKAVELIHDGKTGKMVSYKNGKIGSVDLSEIKERKLVEPELIKIASLFY